MIHYIRKKRANPALQSSCQAVFPSLPKSSQGSYRVLSMQGWMRWTERLHFTNLRILQAEGNWNVLTALQIQVPFPQSIISNLWPRCDDQKLYFPDKGHKRRVRFHWSNSPWIFQSGFQEGEVMSTMRLRSDLWFGVNNLGGCAQSA